MIERTDAANNEFKSKVIDDFLKADEALRAKLYEFAGEGAVANFVQLEFVFPEDNRRWDVV